jgi:hypothetical protein
MNQTAYQGITKMLNAFPQSAADLRGLLLTYDEDTTGIRDDAIIEAAQRFRRGDVSGQNRTFAPSIAEFCSEARRIAEMIPYRDRPALPAPRRQTAPDDREARVRMKLKIPLWQHCLVVPFGADILAEANARGLDELIALAQEWNTPIPDEAWEQRRAA